MGMIRTIEVSRGSEGLMASDTEGQDTCSSRFGGSDEGVSCHLPSGHEGLHRSSSIESDDREWDDESPGAAPIAG
jgi:hypothetical protein